MPELTIWINDQVVRVAEGTTVAAAMVQSGVPCRASVTGQPRTALCGMGICFECRAIVDGIPHSKTCQIPCRNGMRVETQR